MKKMKTVSTMVVGGVGLLYGLIAILFVYRDAPMGLQAFIIAGVAATGASVGWLAGIVAGWFRQKLGTDGNLGA